jgi:hypothetical protein
MAPSTVTSAKYDVEKFTGHNNFTLWQVQVRHVLVSQGLDAALEPRPPIADMSNKDWTDISKRALSMIALHLAPDVLLQVLKEDTPVKLWARLEVMYQQKFLSTRIYAMTKLMSLKMAEGTKLSEHIDAFNLLISELASLDEVIDDERKALQLVTSLPKSYEHLVQTMLYGATKVSFTHVMSTLLADETRKKINPIANPLSHPSSSALTVTRPRFKGKSTQASNVQRARSTFRDLKAVVCWNCGNKGHISKNCRSPPSSKPASYQANVAIDDDTDYAL